jgi:hypothetical protein
MATVEVVAFVELDIEDEEQLQADPIGMLSDGEAAETAIATAIQDCEVFVFGGEYEPAKVHIESIDIRIEGEE